MVTLGFGGVIPTFVILLVWAVARLAAAAPDSFFAFLTCVTALRVYAVVCTGPCLVASTLRLLLPPTLLIDSAARAWFWAALRAAATAFVGRPRFLGKEPSAFACKRGCPGAEKGELAVSRPPTLATPDVVSARFFDFFLELDESFASLLLLLFALLRPVTKDGGRVNLIFKEGCFDPLGTGSVALTATAGGVV